MRHHLVIDELIALGDLHHIVERHHPPEGRVLEDDDFLQVRIGAVEDLRDFELLRRVGVDGFLEPAPRSHGIMPRLCSVRVICSGSKALFSTSMPA